MRKTLFFLLIIINFTCSSQKSTYKNQLDNTDYEVIKIFYHTANYYEHFLNDKIEGGKKVSVFSAKYLQHRKAYLTADSICRNSIDTLKLKISCPLAYGFSNYKDLLNDSDLEYLKTTYQPNNIVITLDTSKVSKFIFKDYRANPEAFLLQINSIYYTENKGVAIIEFSISNETGLIETNYFMLENMRNIWWRPLGTFRL